MLGILLAGVANYTLMPKKPEYKGVQVTRWLERFDQGKAEAVAAIRAIGEPGLPYINRELRAKDPGWKLKLVELAKKQSWIKVRFTPDRVRRFRAIQACEALGPLAKPAIPALGEALGYGSGEAVRVLEAFGPEAVPALACALTNAPGCSPPYATAYALGRLGAKAKSAVPSLVWTFEHHSISWPRAAAASALGSICQALITNQDGSCSEVKQAKASLLRGLSDPKQFVVAARALGQMGSYAAEAAPVLRSWLDDPDPHVRQLAAEVLQLIVPQYATR